MGKARGVSRGLMSSSTSSPNAATIAPPTSEASCSSFSPPAPPYPPPSPPPYLRPSFLRQQLSLAVAGNTPVDFPFLVEPGHPLEENEWIALHTIGLVENLCSIFDPLYEMCLCRSDSGGGASDEINSIDVFMQSKKPVRQVISHLLSECNDTIQSSRVFPVTQGQAFSPSDLREEVSRICHKLLVCLVHIYTAHVSHLEQLDLVAHMNTIAKHFFAFTGRFKLIEGLEEDEGEGETDNKVLAALHGFHRRLLATPAPNVKASAAPSSATATETTGVTSATSSPLVAPVPTPTTSVNPMVSMLPVQE